MYSDKTTLHPIPTNINNRRNIHIILKQNDPLKRLIELCKKGGYYYKMNWNIFANGIMMECSLHHIHGRKLLYKEVKFIENVKNVENAKRDISSILLNNIGLGFDKYTSENSFEEKKEEEKKEEKKKEEKKKLHKKDLEFFTKMMKNIGTQEVDFSKTSADAILEEVLKELNTNEELANVFKLLKPVISCPNATTTNNDNK
jgi:hypothetical protein